MPSFPLPFRRLASACVLAAGAFALLPGTASANVPLPASLSLPVMIVPSMGGWSDGLATFVVTFTGTSATAIAASAGVGLGPGHVFHIDTCIKAHAVNSSFATTCQQRTVDTTTNGAPITVAAATASTTMARPAGGSAYFSFTVTISMEQSDGTFTAVASSWPSSGLTAAAVPVPAVNSLTGPAPTTEGVLLGNGQTGGINSGQPDSFCEGWRLPTPAPPGSGISTTSLGPNAPAYYEVGDPTRSHLGQAALGVMLVIHGGGWSQVGQAMVAGERAEADQWRALGWETVNIDYSPCNQSFSDVKWFYDQARQTFGTTLPYCALGASAGGNLALMLAAARPSAACVISEAGPTDGTTIKNESTPAGSTNGPRALYNQLSAAVGSDSVPWWSPALFAIHARVLWAVAAGDPYIPYAQGAELQTKMQGFDPNAYVDVLQLASGTTPWVHAYVSSAALSTFQAHEQQLVAPLVGG